MSDPARRLRWLPARESVVIDQFAVHGRLGRLILGITVVFGVFCLPPVTAATHVGAPPLLAFWFILSVWLAAAHRLLHARAYASQAAFLLLVFGNIGIGALVCLAVVVLSRSPQTPLWGGFTLMACIIGATDAQASLAFLCFLGLAPLSTIPFFLAGESGHTWAIVGPVTCSVLSTFGYQFLAQRGYFWRRDHQLREMKERLDAAERERDRLARDLHDSVGTALSYVALYASSVEQQLEIPDDARHLATTIHAAARSGLDELRAVIHALPQAATTLGDLSASLELIGSRAAEPMHATLRVDALTAAHIVVGGRVRMILIRAFHEALHNALKHGHAKNVTTSMTLEGTDLSFAIADDGAGFDPTQPSVSRGRGLPGLRARAIEIGGRCDILSTLGTGTRVIVTVPLSRLEHEDH
jgi:signal transduction histidine kinase